MSQYTTASVLETVASTAKHLVRPDNFVGLLTLLVGVLVVISGKATITQMMVAWVMVLQSTQVMGIYPYSDARKEAWS